MLLNYLKIALKVLARRKFFTGISLFGVAFTLMMVLAVTTVIDHTLSPAPPEVNLDRTLHISYVIAKLTRGDATWDVWDNPGYGVLDRYARELPGVEATSIFSVQEPVTSFVGAEKMVFQMRSTDAPYWEILDFAFVEGGPFTEQDDATGNRVAVVSEATRQRVFGDRPAVGKRLDLDGREFRVVGVVQDVDQARTSAVADVWTPNGSRKSQEFRQGLFGSFSALLLAESEDRFPSIRKEFESRLEHVDPGAEWDTATMIATARTRLEELVEPENEAEATNPPVHRLIWQYAGGVLLWMLLPGLNLVSINMSRIIERSSEIGVRKAFGASTLHLVGQFILENVVLCLLGSVLALGGAAVLVQVAEASGFQSYSDVQMSYRVFLYAVGFACLFGVLSGALPAWWMSRLHPVEALRGGAR
jgi:putative ABC transport system permease protein